MIYTSVCFPHILEQAQPSWQGSVEVSVIHPVMFPQAYCQYLSNQTLHPPHNVRERTLPLVMVSSHILNELCSSLYCKCVCFFLSILVSSQDNDSILKEHTQYIMVSFFPLFYVSLSLCSDSQKFYKAFQISKPVNSSKGQLGPEEYMIKTWWLLLQFRGLSGRCLLMGFGENYFVVLALSHHHHSISSVIFHLESCLLFILGRVFIKQHRVFLWFKGSTTPCFHEL